MDNKLHFSGKIIRKIFENVSNGFAVALFDPSSSTKKGSFVIKGPLVELNVEEPVELMGRWVDHPKFGRQFEVEGYKYITPTSKEGLVNFLSSKVFNGIGPAIAKRIVDTFGEKAIEVFEKNPDKFLGVKGIGDYLLGKIKQSYQGKRAFKDLLMFLSEYQISHSIGLRIYKVFGEMSLAKIKENPYMIAERVNGVGFKTTDSIALCMGMPLKSPNRLKAALKWILLEQMETGAMCTPKEKLVEEASARIAIDPALFRNPLEDLITLGDVMYEAESGFIYTKTAYNCEMAIASNIKERLAYLERIDHQGLDILIKHAQKKLAIKLTAEQFHVARQLARKPIAILTGGPGTGKTTLVSIIIAILKASRKKFALAAPTGRAAKRLQELTQLYASTVHRLLEFQAYSHQFLKNSDNPLNLDTLILDETSMVDAFLFQAILEALPKHSQLILVGDKDQLPSIGPGQVLKDLIKTNKVPYFELTHIFRQVESSSITIGAHTIKNGSIPAIRTISNSKFLQMAPLCNFQGNLSRLDIHGWPKNDCFFIHEDNPEAIRDTMIHLYVNYLPKHFGNLSRGSIQILTPIHRGHLGTIALNNYIQKALLQKGQIKEPLVTLGQNRFFVGDMVIQLKNNYTHEIFNGDIGEVKSIDLENSKLIVHFYDKSVELEREDMQNIALAYAISIHKSQGSEFKIIIMPVVTEHFIMLKRNILYTALTRAKKLAIMLGTKKALIIGVKNTHDINRLTGLYSKIVG